MWTDIADRYINSVARLDVINSVYNPYQPYLLPDKDESIGTGFIVNGGFIVTNSHVVRNASNIYATFPGINTRILMKVYSICVEKDVAILTPIDHNDVLYRLPPLPIGNHLELELAEPVMTIGYPAGSDTVKVTTGVISGFGFDNTMDCEDIKRRDPVYIQITAPLNPGNSGGPLINNKGEVVGINAAGHLYLQNIGYAIGSLVLTSVYGDIISGRDRQDGGYQMVNTPTFGINWMRYTTDDNVGIYIRKVFPDSCFHNILHEGDVITDITFNNINAVIHNSGNVSITGIKRKLILSELVDIIPHGVDITVGLIRDDTYYEVSTTYSPSNIYRLHYIIPSVMDYNYVILAGMCCQDLNLNLAEKMDCPDKILKRRYYTPRVIITNIFPESTLGKLCIFKVGDIIKTINHINIVYIQDIYKVVHSSISDVFVIKTRSKKVFTINVNVMYNEDMEIYKHYRLDPNTYILYKP